MASSGLVDLAAERLGGRVVYANDEFFAGASNMLAAGAAVWLEGEYTDQGKWMDGWETRRRREPGNDFCIIELGAPGVVSDVVVETTHFRGNHPEACALGGVWAPGAAAETLVAREDWMPLLGRSGLEGDSTHAFDAEGDTPVTHVRLDIYPDGGVARLRLLGRVVVDRDTLGDGPVDLAQVRNGGTVVEASDGSFGAPANMLLPGRSTHMGDGWETRRRRGPGHDWAIVRLGSRGTVERIEICTEHFKGNYPAEAEVHLADAPDGPPASWNEAVPRSPLGSDAHHVYDLAPATGPVTHARLSIFPDGGISRFRVIGRAEAP